MPKTKVLELDNIRSTAITAVRFPRAKHDFAHSPVT
jgi:hypothetical protein